MSLKVMIIGSKGSTMPFSTFASFSFRLRLLVMRMTSASGSLCKPCSSRQTGYLGHFNHQLTFIFQPG